MSEETKLKLERNWEPYNYLALDEMGMIAKDFFALLSRNWRPALAPVARPIRDALYYPSNSLTDSIGSQVGRATFEEFTTVVILKQQRRIRNY